MLNIIVATHGNFAKGILDSLFLIIGKQKNVFTLSLLHDDDFEDFKKKMLKTILMPNFLNKNDTLIFVDLFAASPFNSVVSQIKILKEKKINFRIISGVNLPMLIEAFALRKTNNLNQICKKIVKTGKDGIIDFLDTKKK